MAVITHKNVITDFTKKVFTVLANAGTRAYKGFFSALGGGEEDQVTMEAVEQALKAQWTSHTGSYLAERLSQLETAIANGTVKQTLRGTALRNIGEGLSTEAKKKFLEQVATRATSINETTIGHIRVVAKDIVDSNGTLLDFQTALKQRLKDEITEGKADTIARTEYRSAYSYGQNHAVEKLDKKGLKVVREWQTSGSNVRPSHQIDGEQRGPDEVFSNGLLYPMDPSADIEETINCNCSLDITTEEIDED